MNKGDENSRKAKLTVRNVFYHNTFVLIFSFICAVVIWFTMAANNSLGKPTKVYDVPITVQLSDAAQEEGIRVFSQSIRQAVVSITGSGVIVNKVTADDLSVVARLSPLISKLSGNTMQTETVVLTASKQGNIPTDYEVGTVEPQEVSLTYDRYKEASFTIENNMKYTAANNFFVATPEISATQVVVSGPESSVNKISKISLDYEIAEPISQSRDFTADLTVYDKNNKAMKLSDLYLELSISSVKVNLNVLNKQKAKLELTTLNVPEGFSESRITVEPEFIEIAGDLETVSKYKTIALPSAIDFTEINTKKAEFSMEIPMPAGVKNVSQVEKAKVSINLNGFKEASITTDLTPSSIKLNNVPEDKTVTLVTKSLQVDVVGSTAQISRLTPESVYVTVDMAKMTEKNGNIEVPVSVSISGATSCWVYGKYAIHVNVQDKAIEAITQASQVSG